MRLVTPRAFEIDLRSLAALRIGLGALLLLDLGTRALDLEAHYSDAGVLPRVALRTLFDPVATWSLHALSGAVTLQAVLFGVAAVAALSLLLGFRSRLAASLSFVLLVSLHHRNPAILVASDLVLRLTLFWSLFLPLDGAFAVQRRAVPGAPAARSAATAALLLQVTLIYLFSLIFKLQQSEWRELTALSGALAVEGVTTAWGRWLGQFPTLLGIGTLGVLLAEGLAIVLPYVPRRREALRVVTVLAMAGLHMLAIAPAMNLGLTPLAITLAWLPFLPGRFWDHLHLPRVSGAAERTGSPILGIVAVGCLMLIVIENVASLDRERAAHWMPVGLTRAVRALGLAQEWRLWERPLHNRYYVFAATLENGETVDLHTGSALDWERPRRRSRNNHWWKYQLHLARPYGEPLRPYYARQLANAWNHGAGPSRRVAHLELVRIDARAGARNPATLPRQHLWSGNPSAPPQAERVHQDAARAE